MAALAYFAASAEVIGVFQHFNERDGRGFERLIDRRGLGRLDFSDPHEMDAASHGYHICLLLFAVQCDHIGRRGRRVDIDFEALGNVDLDFQGVPRYLPADFQLALFGLRWNRAPIASRPGVGSQRTGASR